MVVGSCILSLCNCNSNVVSPTMGAATPANLPSPTALAGDYFSLVEVRGDIGEI